MTEEQIRALVGDEMRRQMEAVEALNEQRFFILLDAIGALGRAMTGEELRIVYQHRNGACSLWQPGGGNTYWVKPEA